MDAERRIAAGNRVNGDLAALMSRRNVSTAAHLAIHNAVFVQMLLYMEMRSLHRIYTLTHEKFYSLLIDSLLEDKRGVEFCH